MALCQRLPSAATVHFWLSEFVDLCEIQEFCTARKPTVGRKKPNDFNGCFCAEWLCIMRGRRMASRVLAGDLDRATGPGRRVWAGFQGLTKNVLGWARAMGFAVLGPVSHKRRSRDLRFLRFLRFFTKPRVPESENELVSLGMENKRRKRRKRKLRGSRYLGG
jgi:hypothetical protein